MGGNYEKSIYKQLIEIMERLESVEKDLKDEKKGHRKDVSKLNEKITKLEDIIKEKDQQIKILSDNNERFKRIINNDSSNSSLPPSPDQKGRRADQYNSRKKSGRKPGGQKGHTGSTLMKKDVEKKLQTDQYVHKITAIGKEEGEYIKKYVLDFKVIPVINEIRIYHDKNGKFNIPPEYKSGVTYSPFLKAVAVGLYTEGVMSNDRICKFINTLTGDMLEVCAGSIYGFCKSFARITGEEINKIENELLNQETVCTDATVVTMDGKQGYIRNFSSGSAVLYVTMKKKSRAALDAVPFLASYTGKLEHGHETVLYHYGTGHRECNVHLLRYLEKNKEEAGIQWASGMAGLLCCINE